MMKRMFVVLFCTTLLLSLFACKPKVVDPREREVIQALDGENNNYDAAIAKAKELYEGKELREVLAWVETMRELGEARNRKLAEIQPERKLEIQNEHRLTVDGQYAFVRGHVKNISKDSINSFMIRVDFVDSDSDILDSDTTYDNLKLEPGARRSFEIMHRFDSRFKGYIISVVDVR